MNKPEFRLISESTVDAFNKKVNEAFQEGFNMSQAGMMMTIDDDGHKYSLQMIKVDISEVEDNGEVQRH